MVRRIKWYPLLRQVHLYAAFITGTFLLMYFVTGYLLVRAYWFEAPQPPEETRQVALEIPASLNGTDLSKFIQDRLDIPGKRGPVNQEEDGFISLQYYNPGATWQVRLEPGRRQAVVARRPHNAQTVIKLLHRLHGYGGGLRYDLYVLMMDLASAALVVFVVTGVYLWMIRLKNKAWGLIALALGLGYTGWVVMTFWG